MKPAPKTNDVAGDGTTTATLLAQAIVREGNRNVHCQYKPDGPRKRIEKAVAAVIEELKANSKNRKQEAVLRLPPFLPLMPKSES